MAEQPVLLTVAVAKVSKWAQRESGDTLEMIERPHGGLSFVLADGQGHGHGAKSISNLVAKKAISLLADGVRDGAAARATHDFLYAYHHGRVSATLTIISVDLVTRTIVLSRNSHCPILITNEQEGVHAINAPSEPIGLRPMVRPTITQIPMVAGTHIVVFTDGILNAGQRYGNPLDVAAVVQHLPQISAQDMADAILAEAMACDQGRPEDDMSVVVLSVDPWSGSENIRRLLVSFPIP
jgi:serine phosphatase RsbU (regulator of sigma subunit)